VNGDGEALIRMQGIVKAFGGRTVLDGLDLCALRGERLALIGPSGSGKSTILRILMTLESPDRGRVEIAGDAAEWRDEGSAPTAAEIERLRRHCGIVFQQFHLFPHLTAEENVALAPLVVQRRPAEEARGTARKWLERVGLGDRLGARPHQLSGGEKQRVAIARALAPDPDVLLLDEITSALDPERIGEVLEVIEELALDASRTFVLVTHQMRFAHRVAGRVLFLEEGRIVESGPPEQVLEDPADPRTRRFLSSLLEGRGEGPRPSATGSASPSPSR